MIKTSSPTIKIEENLKEKLDNLKVHPRQSYNELIKSILKKL